MKYKKVHIVGGSGAGKTTLAKAYSQWSGVPYAEIDDIFWLDVGNRSKRSIDERSNLLQSIIDSECWVMEGVFYKWLTPSFESAEKIIVLNTPKWVRFYRIIKRALCQIISGPKSYFTTVSNHLELIRFNHSYNSIHYIPTLEILAEYGDKVVICNNYKEAMRELNM